tara:strand:- start:359 stop:1855 length:1497 start_codon:yes stop_codon:yes gene_type:complete
VKPQEIPVSNIKILNRLRKVNEDKVNELSESIKQIGLLHPLVVARKENYFLLLSGNHRFKSYQKLGYETIPAIVKEDDKTINQLIEVSENLISNRLNAIEESQHIVLREELLIKLGKKAVIGTNQHNSDQKLTNAELAKQLGVTRRVYSYKKQVANIIPEVQKLIGNTKFAEKMMDMVHLSKQTKEIQIEVGKILHEGLATTYNRAFVLANLRLKKNIWSEDIEKTRDECGIGKSIMKFERKENKLNDICKLVSKDENLRVTKTVVLNGTSEIPNYTMLPEHSRWFINYFSKKGDVICDSFFGRGTNIIAGAYEGRKVIGFDLSKANLEAVRNTCIKYTPISPDDLQLHHSCGVEMKELSENKNLLDLALTDIPYFQAEIYNRDDSRDLGNIKKIDEFLVKIEKYLINIKRLIRSSSYSSKIFKPIIIKCGTKRLGKLGVIDLGTEIEILAKKVGLVVHDKIYNELRSSFAPYGLKQSIENKYTIKSHETNIVLLKYD